MPQDKLSAAWEKFKIHFHNLTIQQNILNAKEEEYQEGFVRDLFVAILGYTLKPQPDFNLVMEQKSTSDATKSDGAILSGPGLVIAVIELKDTTTTDLDRVVKQAFNYKHQHKECRYVITSNFQHLRLYINDSIDYETFDLFRLTKESFALMYCCLQQASLQSDVPLKMKQQSIVEEENVTKKLYADYSRFRKQLFGNIVVQNPQYNKLDLFKKTQKLLDRFLFILFAEDRMLLPPNSVRRILSEWESLRDMDAYAPLYDRFKKFFGYLNTGYQSKDFEVFAYNGGLFKPDEILDHILIDDQLLYDSCKGLSNYDFETEVDVNILGHIFEHSLSEIEKIEQELAAGLDTVEDPEAVYKSKRKKDGVFYTPRYITKYIVENTVGALCVQKREEMKILPEDYVPKKRKADTLHLLNNLEEYRQWLLQLTICDPACGSGAFLNQALEFLIDEHQDIDAMKARLFGDALMMSDVETSILENNLYGVDINEEATDIAKLSLWLRTARKGRKLNDLNSHIKCGNSLIDDPAVAGDKAFNWQTEFPEVFAKGGFDVIIGNPPYVRHETIKELKNSLQSIYNCFSPTADLYTYFFERGISVLRLKGYLGFISPNKFINSNYGERLRRYLSQFQMVEIVDFGELPVFSDASTFPAIFILNKSSNNSPVLYSKITELGFFDLKSEVEKSKISVMLDDSIWQLFKNTDLLILEKLLDQSTPLKTYVNGEIKFGIKTGLNEAYIINELQKNDLISQDSRVAKFIIPFIDGDNVRKYRIDYQNKYIIAAKMGVDLEDYPVLIEHFNKFKIKLENRSDQGEKWYQLRACSYYSDFEKPKILYPDIALESRFTYDEKGFYPNATLFVIPKDDKYLLALLNSKVAWFFFERNCPVIGDITNRGRLRLKTIYISAFPVKQISDADQNPFINLVDTLLIKKNLFQDQKVKLLYLLANNLTNFIINKRLEDWPSISFKEFLKELEKQKIKLSLSEKSEWMQYFEAEKAKANAIQDQINETDKEIDAMVYALYGLTEEEIRIVEGSN